MKLLAFILATGFALPSPSPVPRDPVITIGGNEVTLTCEDMDHAIAIGNGVIMAMADHILITHSGSSDYKIATPSTIASWYIGDHAGQMIEALTNMKSLHCKSA